MKNSFRLWDKVDVQLYDGKKVTAKIIGIDETVAGTKLRIRHDAVINYIDAAQVIAIRRTV